MPFFFCSRLPTTKMPPKLSFARPPKFSSLVAVEDRHAAAGVQQLQRGADAGQAAADDDDVALVGSHAFSSVPDVGPARVVVVCFCP
jgi:hypothetical protein